MLRDIFVRLDDAELHGADDWSDGCAHRTSKIPISSDMCTRPVDAMWLSLLALFLLFTISQFGGIHDNEIAISPATRCSYAAPRMELGTRRAMPPAKRGCNFPSSEAGRKKGGTRDKNGSSNPAGRIDSASEFPRSKFNPLTYGSVGETRPTLSN